MRTLISITVAILALTVLTPGHAEEATKVKVEQNFFTNLGTVDNSVARRAYDGASETLQGLTETLTNPIITVDKKEYACLARNIFFEAGNEPIEGKVAVGLVTLNRTQDGRFSNTVCGVVDQKITRAVATQGIVEKRTPFLGTTKETQTVWSKLTICQFSWRCMFVRNPKSTDERWLESQFIALKLLEDSSNYADYREKYADALYFHATGIRPLWANSKKTVNRIGGHIFYSELKKI